MAHFSQPPQRTLTLYINPCWIRKSISHHTLNVFQTSSNYFGIHEKENGETKSGGWNINGPKGKNKRTEVERQLGQMK